MFTGKLRPFPQTEKRTVPEHIGRPDYADHPKGFPLSEQAVKGSSQIKILDDEEIEGGWYFHTCLDFILEMYLKSNCLFLYIHM